MKYPRTWEDINKDNYRMKVLGGWIVVNNIGWETEYGKEFSTSCCFVPDQKHEWELED